MPDPTEYVYLIGSEGSPIVKIGRSIDVPRRLADIQRMSPLKLSVLWQTKGGAELETALHRHFKAFRSHGEWFELPEDDAPSQVAQAIIEIAAEEQRKRIERHKARKIHKARQVWRAPRRRRPVWTKRPVDSGVSDAAIPALDALDREIAQEIATIREISDPYLRIRAIFDAQDQHRQKISELAVTRRGVIAELLNQDLSKAEIARQLGITRARVSQLTAEAARPADHDCGDPAGWLAANIAAQQME